jgi:hypothetical protein
MSKKKLDIAGKIGTVPKQLSVQEIELATQLVHHTVPKEVTLPYPIVEIKVEKTIVQKEKKIRLSIDIPPKLHKRLKIKAVENDTNVMHYVEKLIENDLGM